jgi:hypothetical protein
MLLSAPLCGSRIGKSGYIPAAHAAQDPQDARPHVALSRPNGKTTHALPPLGRESVWQPALPVPGAYDLAPSGQTSAPPLQGVRKGWRSAGLVQGRYGLHLQSRGVRNGRPKHRRRLLRVDLLTEWVHRARPNYRQDLRRLLVECAVGSTATAVILTLQSLWLVSVVYCSGLRIVTLYAGIRYEASASWACYVSAHDAYAGSARRRGALT